MPRKQYSRKKSSFRKKYRKNYKKSYKRIPRAPKSSGFTQIVRRSTTGHMLYDVAAGYISDAHAFQLDECDNYSKWADVYDSYRIKKVVVTFRGLSTVILNSLNLLSQRGGPLVYVTYDDNDQTPPTMLSDIQQRTCLKIRSYNELTMRPLRFTIYPCVAQEIYETAISTAYAEKRSPWLPTTSAAIPHYGIKWYVDTNGVWGTGNTITQGPKLIVDYTFYLQFKDLRL